MDGKMRTLELIKSTARREGHETLGVWASLGRPYACLGEPMLKMDPKLPALSVDAVASAGTRKPAKDSKNAAADSKSGGFNRPPSAAVTAADTNSTTVPLVRPKSAAKPTPVVPRQVVLFNNRDRLEAHFPRTAVSMAAFRRVQSRALMAGFVNPELAVLEPDAPEQWGSYPNLESGESGTGESGLSGQSPGPATMMGFLNSVSARADGAHLTAGASRAVSNQQGILRSAVQQPNNEEGFGALRTRHMSVSFIPRDDISGSSDASSSPESAQPAGAHSAPPEDEEVAAISDLPHRPEFRPLSQLYHENTGDPSPIYRWRNEFMKVRQQQRRGLQEALWERAQRRRRMRTSTPFAAIFSELLTSRLGQTRGVRSASPIAGIIPEDMLGKTETLMRFRSEVLAQRPDVELTPEEKDEVDVIAKFYESLCELVYRLKAHDPLSMVLIYEVKLLLESGATLKSQLVGKTLESVGWFAREAGMERRRSPNLLLLLTFMRRCVNWDEGEFFNSVGNDKKRSSTPGDAKRPSDHEDAPMQRTHEGIGGRSTLNKLSFEEDANRAACVSSPADSASGLVSRAKTALA
ncbi:hypothetical protein WJX72_006839 [[Myrmecia] bisecta]|uniref:Uncharacterized protein n=1 Tax=[Myrmecia] bisecta TaxID=41462 RepID=A0AAW1R6Y9_9CHLO